jgi:hypothetical protein
MKLWMMYGLLIMGLLSACPWYYINQDKAVPLPKKTQHQVKCRLVSIQPIKQVPAYYCLNPQASLG